MADEDWRTFVRAAVEAHERPLTRYARRMLGGERGGADLAADVVQDAFLQLCRGRFDPATGNVAAWLFTVVRNRCRDIQRKESRMSHSAGVALAERAAESPGPAESAARAEAAATVLSHLGALPDNQQEVIRLRFQQDFSYREIADVTGLSVSHVGVLLHKGLSALRRHVSPAMVAQPATRA